MAFRFILVAKVDNDIAELSDKIFKKCTVDFYDRSSTVGNTIYGRSLQFILIEKAGIPQAK